MLELSAKEFVKNLIFPALHSSENSEYEKSKNEIFVENEISKIPLNYINEILINKKFFYSLEKDCSFRKVQEELNNHFLCKIPINYSSKAYRKGMSYLHFLEPHTKNYKFLRLDIKNCFHSIDVSVLKDCFTHHFSEQKLSTDSEQLIIDGFINLVTIEIDHTFDNKEPIGKRIIPIGFPTSPQIVNIILRRIDILIENLCNKHNIIYTRYADDLLFSEPPESNILNTIYFKAEIEIMLSLIGLKLNEKKTLYKQHTISLNGFVIQSKRGKNYSIIFKENKISDYSGIRISNKKLKNIKTAIKLIEKNRMSLIKVLKVSFPGPTKDKKLSDNFLNTYAKCQLINKLSGYRSFLISLIIFNNNFHCTSNVVIEKYMSMIKNIDKSIVRLHNY